MAQVLVTDVDYLAARLHGRYGRVAEAERLDGLCRLRSVAALSRATMGGVECQTCAEFQRRILQGFIGELAGASRYLDIAGSELVSWMVARFQVENMKLLLRAVMDRIPQEVVQEHLVPLPHDFALDVPALLAADTLETFAVRLPVERPRQALWIALERHSGPRRPFLFETALETGYFQELLDRLEQLSSEDKEDATPIITQETRTFQMMLAVRGRFNYDLSPELLLPYHIRAFGTSTARFNALLATSDLLKVASIALGWVIDSMPEALEPDGAVRETLPAELEVLAWERFLRLCRFSLRRSHMGFGAVVGYLGIRRVEVANLVALSEAIRMGIAPEVIRARLIPRREAKEGYV